MDLFLIGLRKNLKEDNHQFWVTLIDAILIKDKKLIYDSIDLIEEALTSPDRKSMNDCINRKTNLDNLIKAIELSNDPEYKNDSNSIYFYSNMKEYREFSNTFPCTIVFDNKVWSSSEAIFQAYKFIDNDYKERIRLASNAFEAMKLGKSRSQRIRDDWDSIKHSVMGIVLSAKFTQNFNLFKLLLSTKGKSLHEDSYHPYWGVGGQDQLGKILMKLRSNFQQLLLSGLRFNGTLKYDIEEGFPVISDINVKSFDKVYHHD